MHVGLVLVMVPSAKKESNVFFSPKKYKSFNFWWCVCNFHTNVRILATRDTPVQRLTWIEASSMKTYGLSVFQSNDYRWLPLFMFFNWSTAPKVWSEGPLQRILWTVVIGINYVNVVCWGWLTMTLNESFSDTIDLFTRRFLCGCNLFTNLMYQKITDVSGGGSSLVEL